MGMGGLNEDVTCMYMYVYTYVYMYVHTCYVLIKAAHAIYYVLAAVFASCFYVLNPKP